MKTNHYVLSTFAILALALGACSTQSTPVPTTMVEPTDMATEFPTTTDVATEEGMATEESTAVVPVTGGVLNVMQDSSGNSFLVDGTGMTVYVNKNDTSTNSSCDDDCASTWMPVISSGDDASAVGDDIDAAELGTITRADGTVQVTFNGWPLYTYVDDTMSGDMQGQAMDDMWFLISPDGEAVETQTMPDANSTPKVSPTP